MKRAAKLDRRRRLLAAALLALACAACGGGERATSTLTWRLIDDDPPALFDPQELYRRVPVTSPLKQWEQRGGEVVDGGVRLAADQRQLTFSRAFHRPAEELTVLRVILEQERTVTLVFQWAGVGEEFDDARRIEIEGKPPRRQKDRAYTFNLGAHPRWRGEIGRIRLQLQTRRGAGLEVKALRGFYEQLASERLATVVGKAWKVDLGNDVRSAVVTVPGVALERTVTVPEDGRLRFAYGLPGARNESVTFRVKAGDGGEVVYEQILTPAPPAPVSTTSGSTADAADAVAAWHDADLDLERFAGREIPLVFETSALASPDLVGGFPAWANPELYGTAEGEPPVNVVLISIDTLRADRTSLYGNPRPTTPNLDAWAAEHAAVFEHAVAQAPWTLPSHTSMLSGLNAFHHGVNHNSPAPAGVELLAERLRANGYKTLAVTGGGFVHPDYGLGQGFDRFRYWGREIGTKKALEELENHVPVAEAWLEESAKQPFFLFFHTYEVHHRTQPRQPYFDQWSDLDVDAQLRITRPEPVATNGFQRSRQLMLEEPGDGKPVQRPLPPELAQLPYDYYDTGIAYTDGFIRRLLDRIAALELAEHTLVVLTSDHGELLGEHGFGGHVYLYEENLLIPLVVAHPDGKGAGKRIAQQVRSIDIVPTVLDVLGLPPATGIDGVSLVPLLEGEAGGATASFPDEAWSYASASNYGVSVRVANRLKYHYFNNVWPPINGREQVFDLQQDPGEQRDLKSEAAQLGALRQRLHETVEPVLSGPRIAFENRGTAPFTVRLAGSAVRQANLKSVDLDCPCLSWPTGLAPRAEVPPDTSYTLILEDLKRGDELQLLDDQGRQIAAYSLATLEEPRQLALADGQWREAAADEEVERGIRVWWHGARQLGEEAPEESNQALREQLKALGYL